MLYSPDWTNTGFSFILLTVNPFRHSTLTEQGLYKVSVSNIMKFNSLVAFIEIVLKAGVGYKRQNKLLFSHFLNCHQAVNIYRRS